MGFQIFFEFGCFLPRAKSYDIFDSPRAVFGRMSNLAGIVSLDSGFEIFCKSGIVSAFIVFTN